MTIPTEETPVLEARITKCLADMTAESAALDGSRARAQQEVAACDARIESLARRFSAIQVATTTLKGMAPLAPEEEWRDLLTRSRTTLCDELLALPARIRDPHTLGVQTNLTLSIRTIDFGIGVLHDSGYDLTTLRLGVVNK